MKNPRETILVVEDDENDATFIRRAFSKAGITNPVRWVQNGEEAVAYLKGENPFADRAANPFPRFILTDLKMPQMDGLQLLRWITQNPGYRVVPTIVFTSSTAQSDVDQAFACGAGAYIVKPVDIRELERVAKIVSEYWRLSLLPELPV
jgi:CheY-like chemotaxis protein